MSNTPNMGMLLPIVSSTPGPLYAAENNQAFLVIDAHDHTPGNGVPIPTAGISLDGDLPFNSFNASFLRSTRFDNQGAPLALPADIRSLYVSGGNLYYNNGVGQAVQITAGAALNATSIGGIGGDYATSTASVFYTSLDSTFTFWSAPNTPAAIDVGPITLRTITTSPFGITINSPGTLSADYSLTLFNSLPASTKILTVDPSGNIGDVYDVDNSTIVISSNTLMVPTSGITTTQIADHNVTQIKLQLRSTGSTVGTGGVAISSSSGTFQTATGGSDILVTGSSITITTTGRPIALSVISDQSGNSGFIGSTISANASQVAWAVYNGTAPGGTIVARGEYATDFGGTAQTVEYGIPGFVGLDIQPAGTYTYTLAIAKVQGSLALAYYLQLMAYEI